MTVSRFKKAFSLIEAAIVLGIVGLVIGGIWVAAQAVTVNNQVNIASTRSHKIVQDLMHLYKGQQLPTTFTDLTASLIAAKIIPDDMISNGNAVNVWGGAYELVVDSSNVLKVTFYGVPQAACAKFIVASVTGIDSNTLTSREGIFTIYVGANLLSMNPSTFIRNAGIRCRASAQSYVVFYYDVNLL